MADFTWIPERDMGIEYNYEQAVRSVQFGGGVRQLQRVGLNPPARKFNLSFTNKTAVINQIEAFLLQHTGQRFNWKTYDKKTIRVSCSEMSRTTTGTVDKLTCVFQEEFYG